MRAHEFLGEKWSEKYKRSIDCSHPKGFSQRNHCKSVKHNEDVASNEITGKQMFAIFKKMHHDTASNAEMKNYILSHNWDLKNFTPDMFPSEEDFADYDDPFNRVIDIDNYHRVDLSQPIIVGPQYSNGLYSVIDGNHRAAVAKKTNKTIPAYFPIQDVQENFADGKHPGRKGLAKRVGVNCKQSVSKLRHIAAHSSGERSRMAHWCANMKSGRKK